MIATPGVVDLNVIANPGVVDNVEKGFNVPVNVM